MNPTTLTPIDDPDLVPDQILELASELARLVDRGEAGEAAERIAALAPDEARAVLQAAVYCWVGTERAAAARYVQVGTAWVRADLVGLVHVTESETAGEAVVHLLSAHGASMHELRVPVEEADAVVEELVARLEAAQP